MNDSGMRLWDRSNCFRPMDNSPFHRHLTPQNLLCSIELCFPTIIIAQYRPHCKSKRTVCENLFLSVFVFQTHALHQSGIEFFRRIVAQDGTVKNDGSRDLTPDEILHMDWLCQNVEGVIPAFDQIEPFAQSMVRELGLYRDQLPAQKEVGL